MIVTFNLRDFAPGDLLELGIAVQHPDDFFVDHLAIHEPEMAQVIRDQQTDFTNPPLSLAEVVSALEIHAPKFVARLRQLLGV